MANNEIKWTKLYPLQGKQKGNQFAYNEVCKKLLDQILESPPVLVRGHRNELVTFNGDKEEPKLIWVSDLLYTMNLEALMELVRFIENRKDAESNITRRR